MPVHEPDKQYLRTTQYRDASNLNARASLHARYGANTYPWFRWLFDHIASITPDAADMLEVGAGPGILWRENLERLPNQWRITLTDLSEGMVAEERRAIAQPMFTFATADAESLPFADNSFDVLVANHMLYHVPDRPKALSEFRRVLRPGGVFIGATNGEHNMRELDDLIVAVANDEATARWRGAFRHPFTLENGAEQLNPYFTDIDIQRYPDALDVLQVEPLVAYILSIDAPEFQSPDVKSALEQRIQQDMDQNGGIFHISKDVGVFISRRRN